MALFYSSEVETAKPHRKSACPMCYNLCLEERKKGRMLEYMALFGKKKKVDEPGVQAAENKQSNSVTDEMKVILEAREEAQQEKEARALERLQEQEAAGKEVTRLQDQAKEAAEKILTEPYAPAGMTFFMVCDEIPLSAVPETEGNIVIRGDLRGTAKVGSEVFIYQGHGEKYSVKIEKIRKENREFADEASYERVEIEITTDSFPKPENPDEDASRPVQRYAVLTDGKGIENMKDPACRGMAAAGNPRTLVMLCEYGRFGKEPEYFTLTMDAIMTSEFLTPVKIVAAKNGKSSISFAGVRSKQDPEASFLPVFTDTRLIKRAQEKGFGGPGLNQVFALNFAQAAAIGRDDHHQGFLINPGGPVTITIPTKLINDMVKQRIFKERFGEGAADNPSLALGGTGNTKLDDFIGRGGVDMSAVKKVVITNPTNTPEFLEIERAVKNHCGSRANISKLMILISAPEDERNNQTFFVIMDCPEDGFEAECKALAEAMKPHMKTIKTIRFQLFSKLPDKEIFAKRSKWLYSKLPI